jgi:hypothetical protein
VSPSRAYCGPGVLIVRHLVSMGRRGQTLRPAKDFPWRASWGAVGCWRDAGPAWWWTVRRVLESLAPLGFRDQGRRGTHAWPRFELAGRIDGRPRRMFPRSLPAPPGGGAEHHVELRYVPRYRPEAEPGRRSRHVHWCAAHLRGGVGADSSSTSSFRGVRGRWRIGADYSGSWGYRPPRWTASHPVDEVAGRKSRSG